MVGLLCTGWLSHFPLSMCKRGFQDLLSVRPSSLFMLCGCISISIYTQCTQYTITRPRPDTRLLYLPPPHLLTHSEPPTTCCPLPIGHATSSKPRPLYKYHVLCSLTILHIQRMKMKQIECSETSAYNNQTPGKYPKEYIQDSKHGKSLKSKMV